MVGSPASGIDKTLWAASCVETTDSWAAHRLYRKHTHSHVLYKACQTHGKDIHLPIHTYGVFYEKIDIIHVCTVNTKLEPGDY